MLQENVVIVLLGVRMCFVGVFNIGGKVEEVLFPQAHRFEGGGYGYLSDSTACLVRVEGVYRQRVVRQLVPY